MLYHIDLSMNLHPVEEQMIVLDAPASLRGSHSLTGIHVKEWISMSVKTAIIPICGFFYTSLSDTENANGVFLINTRAG